MTISTETTNRYRTLILGLALLAPGSASVLAQQGNIIGLPPEALDRLPGAARLFEVRTASSAPQIAAVQTSGSARSSPAFRST